MPDEEPRLEIVIQDRTYDLFTVLDPTEYDFDEGMTFTELTGGYLTDYKSIAEFDNPRFVAFLIWCAVHRRDPSFTVRELKSLNMLNVMKQLTAALEALPTPAEGDAGPPDRKAAPATNDETPGEPQGTEKAGPSPSSATESETKPEPASESIPAASGFPS